MYPVAVGKSFVVQQVVSGTGTFDGTEFGRAALNIGAGGAQVRTSARKYGADANALTVALVDDGTGNTLVKSVARQSGNAITVRLKRTPSAITATADEVADAINNPGQPLPIVAIHGGTSVVAAAAAAPLTGGVDPDDTARDFFRWDYAANQAGGYFYFEQEQPLVLRAFEMKFVIGDGNTHTVVLERVPLNSNLEPIDAEATRVSRCTSLTTNDPEYAITDIRDILMPGFAYRVTTDAAVGGLVRLTLRREGSFPYL